jgi:hypothetical protein
MLVNTESGYLNSSAASNEKCLCFDCHRQPSFLIDAEKTRPDTGSTEPAA